MSKFDAKDLPPIVHYMQVIVLGCIIEAQFRSQYQQTMQPDEARLQAIHKNTSGIRDRQDEEMVHESFRVAIRLWKAFDTLGMRTTDDNRRVSADSLITAGL
jgi:hypothetical protein